MQNAIFFQKLLIKSYINHCRHITIKKDGIKYYLSISLNMYFSNTSEVNYAIAKHALHKNEGDIFISCFINDFSFVKKIKLFGTRHELINRVSLCAIDFLISFTFSHLFSHFFT